MGRSSWKANPMFERFQHLGAELKRPRVLIPTSAILLGLGVACSYLILVSPDSIFVRWAMADRPDQITMITMGPYPEEADFQRLKKGRVQYIISALDPRLPYEKTLIEREKVLADKYGMTLQVYPMASIFDRQVFADYQQHMGELVAFLKKLDAPAYVHCYLGKHRMARIRNAMIEAGVPQHYWMPAEASQTHWNFLSMIDAAKREFRLNNFQKVLEVLAPVEVTDVDVTYLRGWAHYRLGMIHEAAEDFRQGLALDPTNPRNLEGSGYCYLRLGQPEMAYRQFHAVLEQSPEDEGATTGLGLTYLSAGNKTEARRIFQKVLGKNPDNEEVKGYLNQIGPF